MVLREGQHRVVNVYVDMPDYAGRETEIRNINVSHKDHG